MTENEYINRGALAAIRCAEACLRQMIPECNEDIITPEERKTVFGILDKWSERLKDKINIDEEEE